MYEKYKFSMPILWSTDILKIIDLCLISEVFIIKILLILSTNLRPLIKAKAMDVSCEFIFLFKAISVYAVLFAFTLILFRKVKPRVKSCLLEAKTIQDIFSQLTRSFLNSIIMLFLLICLKIKLHSVS